MHANVIFALHLIHAALHINFDHDCPGLMLCAHSIPHFLHCGKVPNFDENAVWNYSEDLGFDFSLTLVVIVPVFL